MVVKGQQGSSGGTKGKGTLPPPATNPGTKVKKKDQKAKKSASVTTLGSKTKPSSTLTQPPAPVLPTAPESSQPKTFTTAKVHAQRKFAQGCNIYSPPVTPLKRPIEKTIPRKSNSNKVPLPPFSPPNSTNKRPKTEDFIHFLCFRGTQELPEELKFFNDPPVREPTKPKPKQVKNLLQVETGSGPSDPATPSKTPTVNKPGLSKSMSNLPSCSLGMGIKDVVVKVVNAKLDHVLAKGGKGPSAGTPKKSAVTSKNKSNSPEKLNKTPIKKGTESKKVPIPKLSSPKVNHINEQEARFAMTALKLKYQEKRLVSSTAAAQNVLSKITKKVKDRRVIPTRSKGRDDEEAQSPAKVKKHSKKPKVLEPVIVVRERDPGWRNAPSPDIIDGVNHCRPIVPRSQSSSESESSSAEESESSESESSSKESSPVDKPTVKALRNGRSFLVKGNPKELLARSKVKKALNLKRMSTRATRKRSTSPLRELPMYAVKKRKLGKGVANRKKELQSKATKNKGKESSGKDKKKEKNEPVPARRPRRRTKDNASIFLGLISREFSSDEDGIKVPREEDSGDSSSSETKFLEKSYNASLKRKEEKANPKSKAKDKPKKKDKSSKSKEKDNGKGKAQVKKKAPGKRILRSQSSKESGTKKAESSACVTTRRNSLPVTSTDVRVAGAARKTASKYPRKNVSVSNSSGSSSSSSDQDQGSSDSDDSESEKDQKSKPGTSELRSSLRKTTRTSSYENENESFSEEEERMEEERSRSASISLSTTGKIDHVQTRSPSPVESIPPEHSQSVQVDSSSTESSSSESEAEEDHVPPVQKVSIATQVDMDSEEMGESFCASQGTPPLTPGPSPLYMNERVDNNHGQGHGGIHFQTHHHQGPTLPPPQHQPQPVLSQPQMFPGFATQPIFTGLPPGPPPPPIPLMTNVHLVSTTSRTLTDFTTSGVFPISPFQQHLPLGHHPPIPLPPFSSGFSSTPICFSSTSTSYSTIPVPDPLSAAVVSSNLQSHIRSVAANLDIPLVRPVMGPTTHHHTPLLPFPLTRPLTRPVCTMWAEPPGPEPQQPHYSAFRVPIPTSRGGSSATSSQGQGPPRLIVPSTSSSTPFSSSSQTSQGRAPGTSYSFSGSKIGQSGGATMTYHSKPTPPPPKTIYPVKTQPGLSLIQSLPNVSIVPKFDRNSGPKVNLPDQTVRPSPSKSSSSTSTTTKAQGSKSNNNEKSQQGSNSKKKEKPPKEKKEDGRSKRRKELSFVPHPSSPLTVKKDRNPATYVRATKKPPKVSEAPTPSSSKSSRDNTDGNVAGGSKANPEADTFAKLLELKLSGKPGGGSGSMVPPVTLPLRIPTPQDLDPPPPILSPQETRIEDLQPFYPTEEQFKDPLKYIRSIQGVAERFGIARIVPPKSFRPECNVEDDMRFTAYNHYIHRMFKRWGPNAHERLAMMEHLRKSNVDLSSPPMIGGMEVDLVTLYHTVKGFGGLQEVIERHKWNKVSDSMHIPKAANDRATKLDAIYVKYVLPYEMLSENERKRLLKDVKEKWASREKDRTKNTDDPDKSESSSDEEDDPFEELEDCIIKGKSTALSSHFRVARNSLSLIFHNREPESSEVEEAYWKVVRDRSPHLCVYSGSIDCAGVGWGFPLPRASAKHPWNLKVFANHPESILKSLGPVTGATVPTLHVGMIFTSYCWYRDPHGLPWVEYLHSGSKKIWYSIPASHENEFRRTLFDLMPLQCRKKKIWLPSDSAMVPPELLQARGIPLFRVVQNPGEFLVVFPKAYTSAICTGYLVSESVCFASGPWLKTAKKTFQDIRDSREPPVFALERLLRNILADPNVNLDVLSSALPVMAEVLKEEFEFRKKLRDMGVPMGKISSTDEKEKITKKNRKSEENEVYECDTCFYLLHLSLVTNKSQDFTYCLPHGIQRLFSNKSLVKSSVLRCYDSEDQLSSLLESAKARLRRNV